MRARVAALMLVMFGVWCVPAMSAPSGAPAPGQKAFDAYDPRGGPWVAVMGERIGPWRIFQNYVNRDPESTIENEDNLDSGCIGGAELSPYVEWYPGFRLAWYPRRNPQRLWLAEVATTRRGDRTRSGLVIGRSTLAQARRIYPRAIIDRNRSEISSGFGYRLMYTGRKVGVEASRYMTLYFTRSGRLNALAVGYGAC